MKKKKFADGGAVPEHDFVAERLKYRKEPDYFGLEDDTPSGRVALRKYVKEAEDAKALYLVLADIGGADLVGPAKTLDPKTFYRPGRGD